jgi:hypothetical protein
MRPGNAIQHSFSTLETVSRANCVEIIGLFVSATGEARNSTQRSCLK